MKQIWIGAGVVVVLLAAGVVGAGAWLGRERPGLNVAADGLALSGYDPVSYFGSDGPVPGRPELAAEHQGRRYLFASAAHRQRFLAEPERFEPAFGGWCAYAIANGYKFEVDPESYLVVDDRLLLFYDGLLGDARQAFQDEGVHDGVRRADTHWPGLRGIGGGS